MAESRSHLTTANRIAKKYGVEYNNGKGVDIQSGRATVEVETPGTVAGAARQLQGHRGPVYIAGSNQEAVEKAKDAIESGKAAAHLKKIAEVSQQLVAL